MNIKWAFALLLCCISHAHGMLSRTQANYMKKVAFQKARGAQRRVSTQNTQSEKTQEWSNFEKTLASSFAGPIFAIPGGAIGYGLGVVLARTSSIPYSYFSNKRYDNKYDQRFACEEFETNVANISALTGAFAAAAIGGPAGVASTALILAAIFRDDLIRKPSSEPK